MGRTTLIDDNVRMLIDAVVHQAANDYRVGRSGLRRTNLSGEMEYYYKWLVADTERFFKSQWFYMMGGSPAMWKQLKSECDHGYFKLRKGMEHSETHYCKY